MDVGHPSTNKRNHHTLKSNGKCIRLLSSCPCSSDSHHYSLNITSIKHNDNQSRKQFHIQKNKVLLIGSSLYFVKICWAPQIERLHDHENLYLIKEAQPIKLYHARLLLVQRVGIKRVVAEGHCTLDPKRLVPLVGTIITQACRLRRGHNGVMSGVKRS